VNNPDFSLGGTGFKYLSTYVPTRPDVPSMEVEVGQPVTFDDIANTSNGDKLLGYLKADIDSLGKILERGFKESKPSISRFVTFSRMLETFFNGYLSEKLKNDFKEVYTIFSGGDDFFVLGPWDKSIEFARFMRKDFSNFCAGNPDLTFSAGITLVKPHEPLSYCAEIVEAKLKESKGKEGKDRITLFNQTVRWEDLDTIFREAKRIIEWLKADPPIVSRGFANNLRKYGEMAAASGICSASSEVNTKFLRFVPLLVYDMRRNLTRTDQRVAVEWMEDLVPSTIQPRGGRNLEFLRSIIEYALTYTRS
jgi:CRISPR-associated protein Csm1